MPKRISDSSIEIDFHILETVKSNYERDTCIFFNQHYDDTTYTKVVVNVLGVDFYKFKYYGLYDSESKMSFLELPGKLASIAWRDWQVSTSEELSEYIGIIFFSFQDSNEILMKYFAWDVFTIDNS